MAERAPTNGDDPIVHDIHKLRERMSKVEWQTEQVGERLGQGAESFSDLRNSIGEVRKDIKEAHEKFQEAIKPKPMPTWKVAAFAFSVLCVAATVIWMFARYPDRDEFNKAKAEEAMEIKSVVDKVDDLEDKQTEIRTTQQLIKGSVDRQEKAQEKIDSKLDRLLDPTTSPGR